MFSRGLQIELDGIRPTVADDAFIAPNATLIGDVTVGAGASIWFGVVLRADDAPIRIGPGCNIQDNAVLHVGVGRGVFLGPNVSVGHAAVVHNCTVHEGAVIGMRSCIQDEAVIGAHALVAAGAVVTEGFEVPDHHTAVGVPARVLGPNSERSRFFVDRSAEAYRELTQRFRTTGTILER